MSLTNRSTYFYELPGELIAQYPHKKRDDCRLLCLDKQSGKVSHKSFPDLLSHLHSGDVLVLNTSKVIPARLKGRKESGAAVEVLLLRELQPNRWECLVKPGNRLKKGTKINFSDDLRATIVEHFTEGMRVIDFHHSGDFWQILDHLGEMPLPPYIKRNTIIDDSENYQTVYAKERGSAAAPTAGLHFSKDLLNSLTEKGVIVTSVILHIGLDTFRPVKVENILEHQMHREFCSISQESASIINQAKLEGRRIIAVGTTCVRTLESFIEHNFQKNGISMNNRNHIQSGSKWSDLFIYPGFKFQIVDGLLTNFHLPESTLLMLVSAFAGYENVMAAYQQAVQERYRFFSYGDAMLII
ncbi:MAG: tRNA preQ1(34) S-adenosylmethionine ribosyltransferase-isomerase QueA [Candidatus Cloacimonetes bacterium]|nr:tRNA preQ1(34) S-adenosylmethionine ribosyltransferase-isomerase QueA [Candidatus Cloacimonadota bacterium]